MMIGTAAQTTTTAPMLSPLGGISKPFDINTKLTAATAKYSETEKMLSSFLKEDDGKAKVIHSAKNAISKANRLIDKRNRERIAKEKQEQILAAKALIWSLHKGGSVKPHAVA